MPDELTCSRPTGRPIGPRRPHRLPKLSEGVRDSFWLQSMLGGIKGRYDCIKEFSVVETTPRT
jgi:hypothetical protein